MCGLVGIAGDTNDSWKDIYSELLLIDTVRGPHSTGAGFVGRNTEDFAMAKAVGHPFNLFDTKEYEDLMGAKSHSKVILGHNRFATIGEKTADNAHPFMFDNIIGMHNGTLDKWVIKDLHKGLEYGTDSEAVMSSIDAWGIEETVKKMSGAWALVWFDKRTHTLNMLRNDKRPLFYCYSKDRTTIAWASEALMLKYVMDRRNKEIFIPVTQGEAHSGLFPVLTDHHYSWVIPQSVTKKIDTPAQVERKGVSSYMSYGGYYSPFKGGSTMKTGHQLTRDASSNVLTFDAFLTKKQRKQKLREVAKHNPNTFRPPYKDMHGHVVTKPEFTEMVKSEGCCFCNDDSAQWGDFVHILGAWTGPRSTPFVCKSCFSDASIEDILQYAL